MPEYLKDLNEKQREAALSTEGALLILAGAGAGKTKTITHRILHLIKSGISGENILAITFTNKAAKEMRERVTKLLEKERPVGSLEANISKPFLSTFHSLGVYILREESDKLGLPRFFNIFDRNDSKQAVKEATEKAGLNPKEWDPNKMLSAISKEKGNAVTISIFREKDGKTYFEERLSDVWEEYEKILKEERALDFDDLLLKTLLLLKQENIRKKYTDKWQYIHIDEYQDTNRVQYEIAKLLANPKNNIAVVGDIDQSIYSWRGADFKNILRFEKDYPDAKSILLEQNYRSTQNILAVANAIIAKNKLRKDKNLFTKNEEGELLSLYTALDEKDEASFVAITAKRLISEGIPAEKIAVLYRANFQSRIIEDAFVSIGIPYDLIGTKFFERKEIKDAIAYLRASLDEKNLFDFKRIANVPTRGIGKVTLLKILEGKELELSGSAKEKITNLRTLLQSIKEKALENPLSETIKYILSRSGLEMSYKTGTEEDAERLENVRELVSIASTFDHLPNQEAIEKFLERAALSSDQDELDDKKKQNGVRLMTVHAAKGLEWNTVFITGLETNLFPHVRADSDKLSEESMEEERRLFYVALTRAERKLYLSYASIRTIFGSREVRIPSEFLTDIDDLFIKKENGSGGKYLPSIYW